MQRKILSGGDADQCVRGLTAEGYRSVRDLVEDLHEDCFRTDLRSYGMKKRMLNEVCHRLHDLDVSSERLSVGCWVGRPSRLFRFAQQQRGPGVDDGHHTTEPTGYALVRPKWFILSVADGEEKAGKNHRYHIGYQTDRPPSATRTASSPQTRRVDTNAAQTGPSGDSATKIGQRRRVVNPTIPMLRVDVGDQPSPKHGSSNKQVHCWRWGSGLRRNDAPGHGAAGTRRRGDGTI